MKTPEHSAVKTHFCNLTTLGVLLPLLLTVSSQAVTFTVTTTDDSGPGSLRQAIVDANSTLGTDTIEFNIPGGGPHTIQPLSALPNITDPVIIDGWTQPGFSNSPIVELDGSNAGATACGLLVYGGNSIVRGLVINRFHYGGIALVTEGDNVIEGNFIGTDMSGTVARGNGDFENIYWGYPGLYMNSSRNVIGGTTAGRRNIISGNTFGIVIQCCGGGNRVLGNYIGTDVNGTNALGNSSGIIVGGEGTNSIIANLISGNIIDGVQICSLRGDIVQGNLIGTDITGKGKLGNGCGLRLGSAEGTIVGGTNSAARNVISGNQHGVDVGGNGHHIIQGNLIGTDITGAAALGNDLGVFLWSSYNLIGGTEPGARNIISGNNQALQTWTEGNNLVQGNFIGTDITGTSNLPNKICLYGPGGGDIIGGSEPGARNIIAGVMDIRSSSNIVQGNYIGTDVTGTLAIGNPGPGIYLGDTAVGNLIGGTVPSAGNLISGNGGVGIALNGSGVIGTVIQGNLIGTDYTGTRPLGNWDGIGTQDSPGNIIGGEESGAGNT